MEQVNLFNEDGSLKGETKDLYLMAIMLIRIAFRAYAEQAKREKFKMSDELRRLLESPELEHEIAKRWYNELFYDGMPTVFRGVSKRGFVKNIHEDGFLAGLMDGYIVAKLGLADHITID